MIKKNNQTIGAVYKGSTEISKILKGTTLLYENWQTLTAQGVPPLTLNKCKGTDLLDYKIYGQSIQEANLVDNNKIIASSISSGKISIGLTGLTVQDSYATLAFLMSDLFEPNTTYYIHCERVYSTTRTNATGRISNIESLGKLLEYNFTDGKFTTGDTVSGYLYLYGFYSGTVEFNNLYIGRLPYTEYEPHKVPSPTTPIEVQSVGDKTVNLLNYNQNFIVNDSNFNGTLVSIDTNISSGELITVSADVDAILAGGDVNAVSLVLTYEDDTTYTYYYFNSGCIKILKGTEGRSYTTVTATQNVKKVTITVHAFNLSEGGTTIFSNFQIAIGNVIDYEPYGKYKIPITATDNSTISTTTNIYLDAPLRKVGTVSDYIDFENSKVVRIVKQGIIDNNSSIGKFGGVTDYSAFYLSQNDLVDYETGMSINQVVLSPTFKYYPCVGGNVNSYWTDDYEISSAITATYKRILFTLPNTITDTTQAKTWLQTNPIDFYYPTNTPTETTITLPSIPSIKGITVYIVGTNIQPSNMYVKYKGKN